MVHVSQAILGFTQTYLWTRDRAFLDTAIALSDYFVGRLSLLSHDYAFVPPVRKSSRTPRDTATEEMKVGLRCSTRAQWLDTAGYFSRHDCRKRTLAVTSSDARNVFIPKHR